MHSFTLTKNPIQIIHILEMPTLTSRNREDFQTKNREVLKLHATSMVQNLPEIGRSSNLGVKMDRKCLQK